MLMDLNQVEQRYGAVVAIIQDGFSVTAVAQKFGVSRQTLYRWMARDESSALDSLADRSHRSHRVPHQMPAVLEARILELRRQHAHWGPISPLQQLRLGGTERLPSHMAIYRALTRHGLSEERRARKRLPADKRWEPGRPMELWQMDVARGVLLTDGTECKVLTGVNAGIGPVQRKMRKEAIRAWPGSPLQRSAVHTSALETEERIVARGEIVNVCVPSSD